MKQNKAIKKVLVIGSGPTAVGHGTQLTRAAWQACRLLKRAGLVVVVMDSNPASPALDDDACHNSYIEPLTADTVARILAAERPDGFFPAAGGQNALNLCMHLSDDLRDAGAVVLGITPESIRSVGDRARFAQAAKNAGGRTLDSAMATSPEQAAAAAERLGFPIVLRPFFATAGTGSSIVYNLEELKDCTFRAIKNSPAGATLIEKAALGWKEARCLVLRDRSGKSAIAGIIEDVDPMGVHSGDSVSVFPSQTLGERQRGHMADLAAKLAGVAGIEGAADVEFAVNPEDPEEIVVVEMNPWITTSSQIVSFACGFSVVEAAVRLSLGEDLAEACPEISPAVVVAVRAPRFAFEKFPSARCELGTSMKSIGESLGLGGTFREALQKALRGPLGTRDGFGFDDQDRPPAPEDAGEVRQRLAKPQPDRYFDIKSAFDLGMGVGHVAVLTGIDSFFVSEMKALFDAAREISRSGASGDALRRAKADGFSDARGARVCRSGRERAIRIIRHGRRTDLPVQAGA